MIKLSPLLYIYVCALITGSGNVIEYAYIHTYICLVILNVRVRAASIYFFIAMAGIRLPDMVI